MANAITLEELEAELNRYTIDDGSGLSTWDLAAAMNVSSTTIRIKLKQLHQQGRLEVRYRPERDIRGRMAKVPVYSILPKS